MTTPTADPAFPIVRSLGLSGLLVTFADRLSEPANRAALAFRAAVDRAGWDGVEETSTSLTSAYLRFDPVGLSLAALEARVAGLLAARDWYAAPLPEGRRHWSIPTVFGTDLAPQLAEAAAAAGVTPEQAIAEIAGTDLRAMTIGFAPGQPYLGELPPHWNIPRQTALTPRVPEGSLGVAIRQMVLFSVSTPTGWRHIGQTAFRPFRPESETPFPLRPGDTLRFLPVPPEELAAIRARDPSGDGGATCEPAR